MIKAELSVESEGHSLAGLEEFIGVPSGAAGYSKGEPGGLTQAGIRPRSAWVRELVIDKETHAGTAGLDAAITSLPAGLADGLAAARRAGCNVSLVIVQYMSSDGRDEDLGFYLSSDAVAWLGTSGAAMVIDQYIEDPDDASA